MRGLGLFAVAAFLLVGGLLCAQSGEVKGTPAAAKSEFGAAPARTAGSAKNGKGRSPITVTPEREAAVLAFVQRNHAELAELLGYLKASQPEEYERAIKEIYRSTERLAQIQERDALQHEFEVASWTAQSRVQLLAAKLKMGASEELEKQLRAALSLQNAAKLALLRHERHKAADRVSKLDGDIARFESAGEAVIDKQLELLTRAAAEGRPAKLGAKNPAKPAKKKPAN
jgi:hypothetical protein